MAPASEPLQLDLADFDAVGLATQVVQAMRDHAIQASVDAAASVSAPAGWHRLIVTARRSGHVVLSVRYQELTQSRRHNVTRALAQRGWQLDDDGDGATRRFPPGTDRFDPAFEMLAVLTLSGAPTDVRRITAVDSTGTPIPMD